MTDPFTSENPSALGSLLQFTGACCHGFDRLLREDGMPAIVSAAQALPAWKKFFKLAGLDAPIRELGHEIARLVEDENAREQALHEFYDLFHAPELIVPLWESVWLSEEKILFTEETSSVRAWYARFGWEITKVGYEAEDHLGLETAFCGWLYDMAADRDGDAAPGEDPTVPTLADMDAFMAAHFSRWAPQCFAALRNAARTPFWASLLAVAAVLSLELSGETG